MNIFRKTVLSILGVLLTTPIAPAHTVQLTSISLKHYPRIRVVLSVSDPMGRPVPIDPRGFRLFENNQRVTRLSVHTLDQVKIPVFTAVIMDRSGSMRGAAISRARDGASEFVARMRDRDQSAFVRFDTSVEVASDFSHNRSRIEAAIRATRTGSDTALLDAVFQGIQLFFHAPDQAMRAALILTDGRENRSTHSDADVIELAQRLRVSIFAIGLGNKVNPRLLRKLTEATGGRYFAASGPEVLVEIYTRISTLLHARLVVDFTSLFPMDQKWHDLHIEIPHGNEVIRGHKAYLAAAESRMPHEKLREIDSGQQRMSMERQKELHRDTRERRKRHILLFTLVLILIILVLILTMVFMRKYSRRS